MTIHNSAGAFGKLNAANLLGTWISPEHAVDYASRRQPDARPVPSAIKTIAMLDGNELHLTRNPEVRGISEWSPDCETGGVIIVTTWFHGERPTCEITETKSAHTLRNDRAVFSSYRAF